MASPSLSNPSNTVTVGSTSFNCYLLGEDQSNPPHPVEIIEKRTGNGGNEEFYVHFIDLNRRLDRWVREEELIKLNNNNPTDSTSTSTVPSLPQPSSTPLSKKYKAKDLIVSPNLPFNPTASSPSSSPLILSSTKRLTRLDKRKLEGNKSLEEDEQISHYYSLNSLDSTELELEKEHEEKTKVKNINTIQIGLYELECWYYSPFPHKYRYCNQLFLCEFCLKYTDNKLTMANHQSTCRYRHPPGIEVYRDNNLSVFEVDGDKHRVYCQNLCLMAKLFIDHKTAYYDVEPFLFYLLTEYTKNQGYRIVGYFSKEKHSVENNNVACILTFPQYQRKGYGKFLICLSYELSRIEGKIGSPEKPLSDLGKISYKSYWTEVLIKLLASIANSANSGTVTINVAEVSESTFIKQADIISTLRSIDLIRYIKGIYVINCNNKIIETIQAQLLCRETNTTYQLFDPTKLVWTPPVFPKEINKKKSQAGLAAHYYPKQ